MQAKDADATNEAKDADATNEAKDANATNEADATSTAKHKETSHKTDTGLKGKLFDSNTVSIPKFYQCFNFLIHGVLLNQNHYSC